jgi:hypothetical protein
MASSLTVLIARDSQKMAKDGIIIMIKSDFMNVTVIPSASAGCKRSG